MDEQILLSSKKKKEEILPIIASFFADCYHENGKIYNKKSNKYNTKLAITIWFLSFTLILGLLLLNRVNCGAEVLVLIPILLGAISGSTSLFRHDKQFRGIYVSCAPDSMTSILIKPKKNDGSRRFDDDVIYHLIVFLRQNDDTLEVIE